VDAYAQIRESAGQNKLSHAWLLLGEDSKELDAVSGFLAKTLLCDSRAGRPCGVCAQCRKMEKGIHPDLISVERLPDKREITVDQVRALRQEAFVLPNDSSAKVFVIREADTMNQSAQNALLKVLEEPPLYASFLLLGRNPGSFLETIRSRCQELRLQGQVVAEPPSEQAGKLAETFVNGDRLGFVSVSMRLEKLEKEKFDRLLVDLYQAAAQRAKAAVGEKQEAALALCSLTEQLREMRKVYVSPGHCLGWLGTYVGNTERM